MEGVEVVAGIVRSGREDDSGIQQIAQWEHVQLRSFVDVPALEILVAPGVDETGVAYNGDAQVSGPMGLLTAGQDEVFDAQHRPHARFKTSDCGARVKRLIDGAVPESVHGHTHPPLDRRQGQVCQLSLAVVVDACVRIWGAADGSIDGRRGVDRIDEVFTMPPRSRRPVRASKPVSA